MSEILTTAAKRWEALVVGGVLIVIVVIRDFFQDTPSVSWGSIGGAVLIAAAVAGVLGWRDVRRQNAGLADPSRTKIAGEIQEIYCDAPYPPEGADYALVLKVSLTSVASAPATIRGFRLETLCAGKPYKSSVTHDASYWALIQDGTRDDPYGHSVFESRQTVLNDLGKQSLGKTMAQNASVTGWLAFLFSGMFKSRMEFQPPESFDTYRTTLVVTDASGREHRISVRRGYANSGLLGQSPS